MLEYLFPFPMLPGIVQYIVGAAMIATGVVVITWSISEIANAETTYDPRGAPTALVTSGPYRYSRNPGYLGLAIIQIGIATWKISSSSL